MVQKTSNQPRKSRVNKNSFTTKSGKTIKVHRSLGERFTAKRDARTRRRANRLATLPKNRFKRWLFRLNPKRIVRYWFSRDGLMMALKLTGIGIVAGFLLLVGLFAYFRKDLPRITNISGSGLAASNTYWDRTGSVELWQDYDAVKRVQVSSDQISPYMKDATVAIEDKNFYKEGAFDVKGILRAGTHDLFGGGSGSLQGGSTITQQLVKLNEQWTNNRTVSRKVKELILAVELEREYSKNDILTGYLNIAPYGSVEYGAESASRDYFGVSAKDLSLPQAAFMAAIPQSPEYLSPYSDPQYNAGATTDQFDQAALISRQHTVLDQMAAQGYITKKQASDAKAVNIMSQVHALPPSRYDGIKAPYFVLAAKQELINKYGANTVKLGGWKIITTLDLNLQNNAEQIIANNLSYISRLTSGKADEEATVAEDVQTGQIVAQVGGTNFADPDHGQNNYAAGILVSPGSTFKLYDYTTLINNNTNVGAGSVLYDIKGPLPGYSGTCPNSPATSDRCPPGTQPFLYDYDFLSPGPLTLRYALGGSRNIPAVKAMLEAVPNDTSVGHVNSINKVISTADAMIDNPYNPSAYNCYVSGVDINNATPSDVTQCYASAAMGDGAYLHLDDHVNGIATLARLGTAIPRTYILKITDANSKTIYQYTQPKGTQVIKPDAAYIVDNMASDPNASYLPGSCSATTCSRLSSGGYKFHRDNGWTFAIKTGTTQASTDGLMASWSPKYAVVSWVGNHTRNIALPITMETLTEPITRSMMEMLHANLTPIAWTAPSDLKSLPAFVVHNHINHGDIEPSPSNDLFPSWYVAPSVQNNTSQIIDKVSGKVATSCTPAAAKQTISGGNANSFSIDIFYPPGGKTNASAVGTDDVHSCSDSPPSIASFFVDGGSGSQDVSNGGSVNCTTSCTITTTVTQGTHPFNDPAYSQYPGTVNLLANGQVVQSQPVSNSPSTLTFSYSGSGTVTLAVQVTDSVLYQATSANATITFTVAGNTGGGGSGGNGNGNGNGH